VANNFLFSIIEISMFKLYSWSKWIYALIKWINQVNTMKKVWFWIIITSFFKFPFYILYLKATLNNFHVNHNVQWIKNKKLTYKLIKLICFLINLYLKIEYWMNQLHPGSNILTMNYIKYWNIKAYELN